MSTVELHRALGDAGLIRPVSGGSTIFAAGSPTEVVHVLHSGVALIRAISMDGDPAVVDVRSTGAILDDTIFLPDGPSLHLDQAVAVTSCEVLEVPTAMFRRRCDESAVIGAAVIAQLSEQTRRLSRALVDLLAQPLRVRVALRLVDLATALSAAGLEGATISMTQRDLAEYIGTTRSTLNVELRELQSAGALVIGRGEFAITDADVLRSLC
jgi:CRP/FNR family transcriptional regulator, cyclic AMP receptor protein